MPPRSKLGHGTRSYYVRMKCRCEECKKANRDYYHARQKKLRALIGYVKHRRTRRAPRLAEQIWKPPGKRSVHQFRYYKRACPGVDGHRCRWKSHLRKDSKGGICSQCRELLLRQKKVPAAKVRLHLMWLSRRGIGLRTVSETASVAYSTLQDVKNRGQKWLLPDTARRIMKVTTGAKSDGHLVNAASTWKLIDELQRVAKMSKAEIAGRLGRSSPALQIRKRKITARTKLQVQKLHRTVMQELVEDYTVPANKIRPKIRSILHEPGWTRKKLAKELGWDNLKIRIIGGFVSKQVAAEVMDLYEREVSGVVDDAPIVDICINCGLSHAKEDRIKRVKMMLPCSMKEIVEAYPCVYPDLESKRGFFENRMVWRDLRSANAIPPPPGELTWMPGVLVPIAKPSQGSGEGHVKNNGGPSGPQEPPHGEPQREVAEPAPQRGAGRELDPHDRRRYPSVGQEVR